MSTKSDLEKKIQEFKKVDLAEVLLKNPALQKVIDKLFFKKSVVYGLVMACLTAGLFFIGNALIMFLCLGWFGWLIFGVVLVAFGGTYIVKQWRQ